MTVAVGAELHAPFVREWPAWAVPAVAAGEWLALQLALVVADRPPVCAEQPELWWSAAVDDQELAVFGCSRCPVRSECAAYAGAASEPYGIWGGLKPRDRWATR